MSSHDVILSLRPADGSSAAIAAAIQLARAAQSGADDAVTTARAERDAALLDADAAGLAALERKLTAARSGAVEAAERIGAVLSQLEARLATAKRNEAELQVTSARAEAEDAGRALAAWWSEKRPLLAELLQEGERLDTALGTRIDAFKSVVASVGRAYGDIDLRYPDPTASSASNWRDAVETMSHPVRAPHVLVPPTVADRERAEAEERYRRDPHPEGFNPVLLRRA